MTRALKRKKNDTTTFSGTKTVPNFEFLGGGEGKGTNLDEIAWLIANLKETVTQQNSIIQSLKTELSEIKSQSNQTQAELRALKGPVERTTSEIAGIKTQITEELKQVHEQLDTITKSQASLASANTSPNPSYADVARTPPISQPSNVRTLSSFNTTPSTFTDTLYCTVDISRTGDGEGDKLAAGTIRATVEKEIRTIDDYANWRCRAVTVDPKNTNRVKIACRNEAEHQLVKNIAETKIRGGARVLRDELYPIKVDNVKRTAVLDENNEIRPGAAEAFGEENETTVAKIAWLSKKDVPKAYGSMVVYLTKGNDARRLLVEGFFHAGGESGTTSVFERRPRPEQCYNCQEIGHKAFQCKNAQKCAKCAKEGHHHGNCNETILKCVPCGGPHESFSRNCRKLYPSQHE
jgi:zinc knuckle protein